MKREIEFRGRTAKGEWVYGNLFQTEKWSNILTVTNSANEKSVEYEQYKVIPETVGQYVGIEDKNGKKIFEGDIVRLNNSTKSGVVEFKDFEIRCDIDGVKHRIEYETVYEVIGNIFDKESDNGD